MVSASEIVQQPVGKEQGRHVGQKQVNTARMDIATLEVSSPTGHKSGGVWAASLIHVKSELHQFLPCLAPKSPGKAGDFSMSGLCKGPCIKRFPSLGHFLRLSIFNIILTRESKETQVPTSLEKSGRGRFSSAPGWVCNALCHAAASEAQVRWLLELRAYFRSQQPKGWVTTGHTLLRCGWLGTGRAVTTGRWKFW